MLEKLKRYGIRGHVSKLLASYVHGIEQRVKINGQTSEAKTVENWRLQGTILGPVIFILYINDLLMLLTGGIFYYADDTAVIAIGNTWEQVQLFMNDDLSNISDWPAVNRLSLNIKKWFT